MYDYSKLKGRIKEILGDQGKYAELLNISNASVSAKLNGKVPISITEMDVSIEVLKIPKEEIYSYFFTKKVENNSTNIEESE